MTIYFLLFILLLVFVLVELSGGRINSNYKILLTLILAGISGFRFEIGNDYTNYIRIFDHTDDFIKIEPGFIGLLSLVKVLGGNSQLMFLLSSVLTIIPLAYSINKFYPKYFCTALAVYVFSYIYFEGMNTVRQAISMTILFYALCDYLTNRKTRNFVLLTVLATMFHFSVVIVALAGWLIMRFSRKNINVTVFAVMLLVSFVLGNYIQIFTDQIAVVFAIMGRGDSMYLENIEQRGVNSGVFHYVLNFYAFAFLIFANAKRMNLSEFEEGVIKLFVTAVITYNFFINFYIGLRFYWYFYLMISLAIPVILNHVKKQSKALFFFIIISVFVVYTYLSLGSASYSPYKYTFELIK